MSQNILGVRIDTYTRGESLDKVAQFLTEGKEHFIFTPNPEMLVAACNDSYFREILNAGTLNICDSKGLQMACKSSFTKEEKEQRRYFKRIPGVDFMLDICAYAEKYGYSIYLLGSSNEKILSDTHKKLLKMYPHLMIAGHHPGAQLESSPNKRLKYRTGENRQVITDIVQTAPDIVFVGFGHGKQEKWIYENYEALPGVKVMMGVGGSFDMISGKVKRAPVFMRSLGLEWFWRLLQEPKRIGRIWTALVIFSLLFFSDRRHNA